MAAMSESSLELLHEFEAIELTSLKKHTEYIDTLVSLGTQNEEYVANLKQALKGWEPYHDLLAPGADPGDADNDIDEDVHAAKLSQLRAQSETKAMIVKSLFELLQEEVATQVENLRIRDKQLLEANREVEKMRERIPETDMEQADDDSLEPHERIRQLKAKVDRYRVRLADAQGGSLADKDGQVEQLTRELDILRRTKNDEIAEKQEEINERDATITNLKKQVIQSQDDLEHDLQEEINILEKEVQSLRLKNKNLLESGMGIDAESQDAPQDSHVLEKLEVLQADYDGLQEKNEKLELENNSLLSEMTTTESTLATESKNAVLLRKELTRLKAKIKSLEQEREDDSTKYAKLEDDNVKFCELKIKARDMEDVLELQSIATKRLHDEIAEVTEELKQLREYKSNVDKRIRTYEVAETEAKEKLEEEEDERDLLEARARGAEDKARKLQETILELEERHDEEVHSKRRLMNQLAGLEQELEDIQKTTISRTRCLKAENEVLLLQKELDEIADERNKLQEKLDQNEEKIRFAQEQQDLEAESVDQLQAEKGKLALKLKKMHEEDEDNELRVHQAQQAKKKAERDMVDMAERIHDLETSIRQKDLIILKLKSVDDVSFEHDDHIYGLSDGDDDDDDTKDEDGDTDRE